MGAGSSARKVKAEKTLREEAERRAEYEESVRKQLEIELEKTKKELERVRALSAVGGNVTEGMNSLLCIYRNVVHQLPNS